MVAIDAERPGWRRRLGEGLMELMRIEPTVLCMC